VRGYLNRQTSGRRWAVAIISSENQTACLPAVSYAGRKTRGAVNIEQRTRTHVLPTAERWARLLLLLRSGSQVWESVGCVRECGATGQSPAQDAVRFGRMEPTLPVARRRHLLRFWATDIIWCSSRGVVESRDTRHTSDGRGLAGNSWKLHHGSKYRNHLRFSKITFPWFDTGRTKTLACRVWETTTQKRRRPAWIPCWHQPNKYGGVARWKSRFLKENFAGESDRDLWYLSLSLKSQSWFLVGGVGLRLRIFCTLDMGRNIVNRNLGEIWMKPEKDIWGRKFGEQRVEPATHQNLGAGRVYRHPIGTLPTTTRIPNLANSRVAPSNPWLRVPCFLLTYRIRSLFQSWGKTRFKSLAEKARPNGVELPQTAGRKNRFLAPPSTAR